MYIKRKIEDDILMYLGRPEVLAVVGPRQCGKTTMLKKIYKGLSKAVFLSFEDQQILSLFEHNIKQFAETYVVGNKYIFIDEFQYAKHGGKLLKYLYDEHKIKIIISGSSAVDLTIRAVKFLVGRVFILPMYPFDFSEFLTYKDKFYANLYNKKKIDLNKDILNRDLALEQEQMFSSYYEEYLIWGGYPEVVLAKKREEKEVILKNIYNTYFLREVKSILHLADDYRLSKLLKALALQIGQMIQYNELNQIGNTSIATTKRYLNFLSKTYIVDFIRPFFKNKRNEIVKNQKVYFFDTGFRNISVNDFRGLDERGDAGQLLENGVWMELIKKQHTLLYWRDKNKNEVDFIIEPGNGKQIGLEVKNNINKCPKFSKAFTDNYPESMNFCVYLKNRKNKVSSDKIFIPLL
jgi:uncharacterized protein